MNAARAFDELAARGCAPESIALLQYKDKCAKSVMSGAIAKAMKRSKKVKPATNKNTSSTASTDKSQDAAEELAKRIADALPHATRQEIEGHAGFNAPAFGGLLSKEIAASFGVRSSGGAE